MRSQAILQRVPWAMLATVFAAAASAVLLGNSLSAGDAFATLADEALLAHWRVRLDGAPFADICSLAAVASAFGVWTRRRSLLWLVGIGLLAALLLWGPLVLTPIAVELRAARFIESVTSFRTDVEQWGRANGVRTMLALLAVSALATAFCIRR